MRTDADRRASKKWYDANSATQIARVNQTRLAKAEWMRSLKKKPCHDCGKSFPYYVMDWDHVRGDKVANISNRKFNSCSKQTILAEIAKCDLVCANCHRERTYQRSSRCGV